MDHRRREGRRTRGPLAMSLLLHAAVLGLLAATGGSPPKPAKTKVYAVDIVSPPPNVAGEAPAAPLATQEPGPAQPDPAPATPAAQPDPPAPDPERTPPKETPREAPKEPAKAPEPRRTPEQPAQRPSTTTPRTNPADRPKNTERPKNAEERPKQNQTSANRPATNRPAGGSSTQSGTGSGPNRTQGGGTQTGAATGRNPDASSPGGEGLAIRTSGEACPVANFCNNVQRQVQRFFRPPPGTVGATGDVCFRIRRDGSVTGIYTERIRGGSAAFRLAMMEAAEAAGSRRAFGQLPTAFPDGQPWCVELTPSS